MWLLGFLVDWEAQCSSLSLESCDPQALKLMARLSQAMGPSLLPLLHIHLPMTQEKQISG